jgi:hypothetical protein
MSRNLAETAVEFQRSATHSTGYDRLITRLRVVCMSELGIKYSFIVIEYTKIVNIISLNI